MATQRLVNTNFWRDSYVINLDPTEKLVFLYLLTNPATNLAGVYEIDTRLVALDTGIDKDMINKIISRFCVDGKMYYERGWLVLRNFVKHQRLNPSIKKGIEKAINELPAWLQDKISLEVDESKQISLLEGVTIQTDDSLGTESPQRKEIEAKEKKRKEIEAKVIKPNAATPSAANQKIDSLLAAKEQAAKHRKHTSRHSESTKSVAEIFASK